MHLRSFVYIVEDAHDSKDRRRINALTQRLVVEADVATGDGNLQLLAGFRNAIDGLRELPHDVWLFRITEIKAVGGTHGSRSRASHLARSFGHGMHRAQPWIEITPAPVAVKRHGKAALRALNADHARIARTRSLHCVGLYHVIVLLPDPPLAADIWTRKKLLEILCGVTAYIKPNVTRHLARNGRFPTGEWTFVNWSIVGERLIRNLRDYLAVMEHAQFIVSRDLADFDGVESPLFEHPENFLFAALLRDQQHAFLGFTQHDFVRGHAGFPLWDAIEFDLDTHAAAPAHLAGRAGKSGSAHVLNTHNRSGLHGFETGFEQQLLKKRIADLHVRSLRLRSLTELLAGHGRAMDAVAPGFGSNVNHRIAFPG